MPEFMKCLSDIEVVDGQEVMLFCVVTGQPMPSITWYHNDKNIANNDEYVYTYDRQTGHVYLVILDCLADDEGEFQCVATNAAGQAVTKCKLRVLPRGGSKAPSPAVQPLTINVSSVKRDAVTIPSTISPTQSKTRLSVPTSTTLSSPVSASAAVSSHLASIESLTLMPPDILQHTKKIPGQSRKVASYRTVLRRASDNDLLGYRARYADQPHRQNLSWKVADWSVYTKGTVQPHDTQSEMASESKRSLTHVSLQPTIPSAPATLHTISRGSDTAVISSGGKSASFRQPVKVSHVKAVAETPAAFSSTRLFEPPRFTVPLKNQTVRDGAAATLPVRFHGNPTPKLHWFFNQKAVEDEEDFVICTDSAKGESVLWIKEVFPEDDGEFICKAVNDYGSAVTHCRLTVQCKHCNFYFMCLYFTGK